LQLWVHVPPDALPFAKQMSLAHSSSPLHDAPFGRLHAAPVQPIRQNPAEPHFFSPKVQTMTAFSVVHSSEQWPPVGVSP